MESFSTAQRLFAEAIGTALLVFIGAGSVPAILLLEGGTKAPFSGADLGFISMAFGLIVIAMVYTVANRNCSVPGEAYPITYTFCSSATSNVASVPLAT